MYSINQKIFISDILIIRVHLFIISSSATLCYEMSVRPKKQPRKKVSFKAWFKIELLGGGMRGLSLFVTLAFNWFKIMTVF